MTTTPKRYHARELRPIRLRLRSLVFLTALLAGYLAAFRIFPLQMWLFTIWIVAPILIISTVLFIAHREGIKNERKVVVSATDEKKKTRFRFSLRSLLLEMVLCCIAFALIRLGSYALDSSSDWFMFLSISGYCNFMALVVLFTVTMGGLMGGVLGHAQIGMLVGLVLSLLYGWGLWLYMLGQAG